MGNIILRYFLEWLRHEMRVEAFTRYKTAAARRAKANKQNSGWMTGTSTMEPDSVKVIEVSGELSTPIFEEKEKHDIGEKVKDMAILLKNGFDDIVKSFIDNDDIMKVKDTENLSKEKLEELENRIIRRDRSLWELAEIEGDAAWLEWIDTHIWSYIGLSAPLLGATNTLRSVVSGENMGMPLAEDVARRVELCK